MRAIKYLAIFSGSLAVCFGVQWGALRAVGGRVTKCESNYFSSLGRIQAATSKPMEVMILGSSITGRLPDWAQGYEGVGNLGCDGGSGVDALRAMDRGLLPTAPVLVVEANTLQVSLGGEATGVGKAMEGFWFQQGRKWPLVSSYARPGGFAYSWLLAKKIGSAQKSDGEDLGVLTEPARLEAAGDEPMTEPQEALVEEVSDLIRRLKKKGCEVVLVWLPPGRPGGAEVSRWIREVAVRAEIPWWDLGGDAPEGKVALTDGVHMDAPSATRTMESLLKVLKKDLLVPKN